MTRNPFLNALAASLYIILVSTVMAYGTKNIANTPDTFAAPVAILSLFTLSAAVMAYIFGYQPFQLYFENKKKAALDLALKTILVFAGLTIIALTVLFSGVLPPM